VEEGLSLALPAHTRSLRKTTTHRTPPNYLETSLSPTQKRRPQAREGSARKRPRHQTEPDVTRVASIPGVPSSNVIYSQEVPRGEDSSDDHFDHTDIDGEDNLEIDAGFSEGEFAEDEPEPEDEREPEDEPEHEALNHQLTPQSDSLFISEGDHDIYRTDALDNSLQNAMHQDPESLDHSGDLMQLFGGDTPISNAENEQAASAAHERDHGPRTPQSNPLFFSEGNPEVDQLDFNFEDAMHIDSEPFDHIGDHRELFSSHMPKSMPVSTPDFPATLPKGEINYFAQLAVQCGFYLPHEDEDQSGKRSEAEIRTLLSPLLENRPLSPELIHGLLYALLPGPISLREMKLSDELVDSYSIDTPVIESFIAIVTGLREPVLVFANIEREELVILAKSTLDLPFVRSFLSLHPSWKKLHIDVSEAYIERGRDRFQPIKSGEHVETTFLSIYAVEQLVRERRLTQVPSQLQLQRLFLRALMTPYEDNTVLARMKVTSTNIAAVRHTCKGRRDVSPNEKLPSIPWLSLEVKASLPTLQLGVKKVKKVYRLLQFIREIGSERILRSIQSTISAPHSSGLDFAATNVDALQEMHLYLDRQKGQTHLAIARSRFVRHCYFRKFTAAVQALSEKKASDRRQYKRNYKSTRTVSYKLGLGNGPDLEDHDDGRGSPERVNAGITVRRQIVEGIRLTSGADAPQSDIENDIKRYLKEGKIIDRIIRDLSPGILLCFPGEEADSPLLDMTQYDVQLEPKDQKWLAKPIRKIE
jgi:hypothetical protein